MLTEGLITMVIWCKFEKKTLQLLTLYTSFHGLINVYSRRWGHTHPGDKIWMSTETSCHFGHLRYKFQINLFEVWFYTILFTILYLYSPGAGVDNPLGTKLWCQQEHLVTSVICCKFKKISLKSDLIDFFMILHMYIPRERDRQPPGDKVSISTKMSFHFIHLLQVSKK